MSPSESCLGLSTSRARMMRPAHVPKIGLPPLWSFSMAGTKSHASMSFSRVVDSPPGMMSPSTTSSSDGFRTSTASTPHFSSALAWSAKSPWRASTPILIDSRLALPFIDSPRLRLRLALPSIDSPRLWLRLALPSSCLEELLFRDLRGLETDHRVAEILAHARQHVGVLEMGRRLDDRAGALGRVARLEDSGADEDGFRSELHHEGGVGRRRDPARGEVRHGELPGLGHPPHELVRGAERLRLGHQLLGRQRGEAPDAGDQRAHMADRLDDVAGASLALGADHRRSLADAPERLAQIAAAADERDAERELVDVEVLVRWRQHLGLVDVVDGEGLED